MSVFLRALVVTAVLQFVVTRMRAGRMEEEGQAELLWVRYPFVVLANALAWTMMVSIAGRGVRLIRRTA